jgi:predicted transcriptional regulator of viral defense system
MSKDSDIQLALRRLNGLATRAELAEAGYSSGRIRTQLLAGAIVQLSRGVYATRDLAEAAAGHPAREHALIATAAIRRIGSGVVASHQSAAIIHGLAMMARPPRGEVRLTRPVRGSRSQSARAGVHLHNAELPPDQQTSALGVPLTSVSRTVVDLARMLPFAAGVVVADSALHDKKTTRAELSAVHRACSRWPGALRAQQVVGFSDHRSESVLESIARVAFGDQGLPPPKLQAWVGGEYATIGRVDFFWPEHGTVAEADGAMKYTTPGVTISQFSRDESLRDAGFEVVHFSWHQIVTVPWQVADSIRAAFRRADAARSPG